MSVHMSSTSRVSSFICASCLRTLGQARRPRLPASLVSSTAASSTAPPRTNPAASRRNVRSFLTSRPVPHTSQSTALRRSFATDLTPSSSLRPATRGLAPLPNRRLISLSGPDAAKFLQGLVTNNVDSNRQSPFFSAFLDARGRVLWDVFIWTYPELSAKEWACYIEVDAAEVEALGKHLKKHKLRSKIAIKTVDENGIGVYSAWGFSQEELQDQSLIASLEDPRAPGFGIRCLFRGNGDLSGAVKPPFPTLDPLQYTLRRYLFGIPEGQSEIPRESALPMECNVDLSDGIDFRKGCYVGQELTIRTKHTGVVRKRVLPVQLYHDDDPVPQNDEEPTFEPAFDQLVAPGSDIKQLDREGTIKKGRAAGKLIGNIGNVGLALCRLEMMTSMRVSAEGGSWRPGVQFGLQRSDGSDAQPVRIKALIPRWFREREKALWDNSKGRTGVRSERATALNSPSPIS
ncbi:hypothetical protein BDV96DRAFT_582088 [Lophiotrema nucula]|uniref:Iron-sulfur cluster assembly factor IBA57 homolog, mitochondrial n=1 Tax=Lophiotrema nucula TaxID=690887 RepID=A0A6A5YXR9_9PLEO|nr:hypothetical protein BDV96DRAFT_582088 [Lophiotrema nucula]